MVNTKPNNFNNNNSINKFFDTEAVFCRVCFSPESDIKNPLISPCKCTGTMTFIHYLCLKNCLKNRISVEYSNYTGENNSNNNNANANNCNCIFYYWNNYCCEVCLSEYPKYLKHKQITYNLIDFNNKFEQYVQFDYRVYDTDKAKNVNKGVIICKISEGEEITVVRSLLFIIYNK